MSKVKVTIEGTPNPDARKFVLDQPVQYNGTSTFLEQQEADHIPLAKALMELQGVVSVFFMDKFITVSKSPRTGWELVTPQIETVIRDLIETHDPAITPQKVDTSKLNTNERLIQIEAIIDRDVRPGLASDGGGLEVLSLEGSILKVKYQGACGSCPSSKTGTLMAIQDLLRRTFDAAIEVKTDDDDEFPFTSLFKNI